MDINEGKYAPYDKERAKSDGECLYVLIVIRNIFMTMTYSKRWT